MRPCPRSRSSSSSIVCNLPNAASSHQPIAPPTSSLYKVRHARAADVVQCAAVCMQAFPDDTPSLFFSRPRTLEQWEGQLAAALSQKIAAGRESRNYRIAQYIERMKEESLNSLEGGDRIGRRSYRRWKTEKPSESTRLQLLRWQRQRYFSCFVAEPRHTPGHVIACIALSLARPEARLPPPLPTNAPLRCYISNMAVAEAFQRQGIATALLRHCERTARAWGYDCLWLHVDRQNEAAVALYVRNGYEEVKDAGSWGQQERRLMRKVLPPLPPPLPSAPTLKRKTESNAELEGECEEESVEEIGGKNGENGVFVWTIDERSEERSQ